jgi:hypothetical protein
MATKKYDAAVKTGSYTDAQGNQKGRYENIGTVMMGDDGPYLILKRTFNPAGVPNPENRDSIIVSFFTPQDKQQGGQAPAQAPRAQKPAPKQEPEYEDSIPF